MRILAFATLVLISCTLSAQIPPKLSISPGGWTPKYRLHEKQIHRKDVELHLKDFSAEGYHLWKKAGTADVTAVVFAAIGAAGMLVGASAAEPGTAAAGYLCAAGLWTGALICTLTATARRKKAVQTYNIAYGH